MKNDKPFDPRTEGHLLSAYVDGELTAPEAARIEAHLRENEESRRLVAELRSMQSLTGAMRLKEAPPEAWEDFWDGVYNRSERTLGYVLVLLGAAVLGAWAMFQLVSAVAGARDLPLLVKLGIFGGGAGILVLMVSVLRERLHRRRRTRYKDVIR